MTISGFTMVRNATMFYFPLREAIESILPLVDEFIVALGKGDPSDRTLEEILAINSPKIRIVHRVWDEKLFKDGVIFREETNAALKECSGDWCFYLQADEVVHENDFPIIKAACQKYLDIPDVEGLLFRYHHFWADYDHYLPTHGICRREIRIIRNHAGITSWNDANSFRNEGRKLRVVPVEAYIYHYGWVRPPEKMMQKKKEQDSIHQGSEQDDKAKMQAGELFDFGPLAKIHAFPGTHPSVMQNRINAIHWKHQLNYSAEFIIKRKKLKHEKLKYRFLTWFENVLLGRKQLFGYTNWTIFKK